MFADLAKNFYWVPFLVLFALVGAYASKKNNDSYGIWFYVTFFMGMLHVVVWTMLTKTSKNIILDSLLYDVIIAVVYTLAFIYLGCGSKFSVVQWIGTGLAFVGFVMMKMEK